MLLVCAYPLFWMALTAFKLEAEAQAAPFALPHRWVLKNFAKVFNSGDFGHAYLNSLLICVTSVVVAVVFAACAAFAFALFEFKGRNVLFIAFLLGMMIPVHVTLIPLNLLLGPQYLNIKESLWALAGPYIGFALPVSILILRGAFSTIPNELLDAARIDGCNAWDVFRFVAIPLARPAFATVIIFNFLTMWNEFAFALTLLGPDNATLPIALNNFKGERGMYLAETCAALAVVVVPLLVIYIFAQKHIIKGLTAGAVKG
ncbi:MAG: carbohydrate ABC transporter permease [Victivallales bacterium]|nr:carbohydrate ABC transporter permease [Victivallales bacterium]MBR6075301.1 carbohydrate ABC transporter permease [Victivallales bacterium]